MSMLLHESFLQDYCRSLLKPLKISPVIILSVKLSHTIPPIPLLSSGFQRLFLWPVHVHPTIL